MPAPVHCRTCFRTHLPGPRYCPEAVPRRAKSQLPPEEVLLLRAKLRAARRAIKTAAFAQGDWSLRDLCARSLLKKVDQTVAKPPAGRPAGRYPCCEGVVRLETSDGKLRAGWCPTHGITKVR